MQELCSSVALLTNRIALREDVAHGFVFKGWPCREGIDRVKRNRDGEEPGGDRQWGNRWPGSKAVEDVDVIEPIVVVEPHHRHIDRFSDHSSAHTSSSLATRSSCLMSG